MDESVKIKKIVELIEECGSIDGAHHKQWLLDQILRIAVDDYDSWAAEWESGEDGPRTYSWDTGIAP